MKHSIGSRSARQLRSGCAVQIKCTEVTSPRSQLQTFWNINHPAQTAQCNTLQTKCELLYLCLHSILINCLKAIFTSISMPTFHILQRILTHRYSNTHDPCKISNITYVAHALTAHSKHQITKHAKTELQFVSNKLEHPSFGYPVNQILIYKGRQNCTPTLLPLLNW